MKTRFLMASVGAVLALVSGCKTVPDGVERGPSGTIAYEVPIEASEPGIRIHVNNQYVGDAPVRIRIWGDKDGTFHDFGSYEYIVQAFPRATNHYTQTRIFRTGRMFSPQDFIPKQIYFDMAQPPPVYVPSYEPGYYPPPSHYYYGPPAYYGPRIYIGPGYYHHHHHNNRLRRY